MTTKTKAIIGLASALSVSAAIYFGFVHKFKDGVTGFRKLFPGEGKTEEEVPKGELTESKTEQDKPKETPVMDKKEFPLYEGSRWKSVTELQRALQNKFGQVIAGAPSELLGKNTILALRNVGYDVPLSKVEYDNILAGKKKEVAKKEMTLAEANTLAKTVNYNSMGRQTKAGADYQKGKLLAVGTKLKQAGYKLMIVKSIINPSAYYGKAEKA